MRDLCLNQIKKPFAPAKGRKVIFRGSTLFGAQQSMRPLWNGAAIGPPDNAPPAAGSHRTRLAHADALRATFPNHRSYSINYLF
jgi:hypothetical protein